MSLSDAIRETQELLDGVSWIGVSALGRASANAPQTPPPDTTGDDAA